MHRFSFVDIETPSYYNDSICQIAVLNEDKESQLMLDFLVDPEDEFHSRNIAIHGITADQVKDSPSFPEVWEKIRPYFVGHIVVGHNVRFDLSVIFKNIYHYGLEPIEIAFIDTMELVRSRRLDCGLGLKQSCRYFNISLDHHHNAYYDTMAAYELFKVLTKDETDLASFIHVFEPGESYRGYDRQTYRRRARGASLGYRASLVNRKVSDMKELIARITADESLSLRELDRLSQWILENEDMTGNYPFDAISKTVGTILEDGSVSAEEQKDLLSLMEAFLHPADEAGTSPGPDFSFAGEAVCLTGDFYYGSKEDIMEIIRRQGGIITNSVTRQTTIVLVGSLGSHRWSYGNFGSKVKKAMEQREKGQNIRILSENDINFAGINA